MNGNEILAKLFGNDYRIKILKLFIFNPEQSYDKETIISHTKSTPIAVRRELDLFKKIGLIQEMLATIEYESRGKKAIKQIDAWKLNENFQFLSPLQNLLLKITPLLDKEIISNVSRAGKIKLIVISGVFMQKFDSQLDILVVGDGLSKNKIDNAMRFFEAEIGRELHYACFETKDFKYRYEMYDKLIRDLLELDHKIIFDKLGLKR